MAVILSLPRFFTLKFNTLPYLSVPENPPPTLPPGFVKFEENQILSPRAKFAADPSQTGDATLVNIRSCYNNKYWVVHEVRPFYWITASADKPQEDRTKPGCTLFQAQQGVQQQLLLFSIGASMYVILGGGDNEWKYGLRLIPEAPHGFAVVDWEMLAILPPHVSFRHEGNYLCSRFIDGAPYLVFESGLDAGDPLVAHDLSPTNDGSYRIKSVHFGQSWRKNPQNWIWADGVEEGLRPWDILFSFVKISDGVFALRNVGNNAFCGGLTRDGNTDCLNARYPTISTEARLVVEERALQRDISQLTYRLSDSRIYQEEIQEVAHAFTTNHSADKETTVTLSYASSVSRTTNWTNDSSLTMSGVKVNLEFTTVPVIENAEVKLSTEFSHEYEWGVAKTTESTRQETYTVLVPPLTTVKVTLMCTKAACDVPFTYTQRDLLISGERVTTIKDDGIFTGINSYNFRFESSVQVES
ncbi:hypothetical protein L1987_81986 [Smallanthus sonchifolius]|uniref:Uncharacterized protein n=1 Tax=Smallanthus sonchifolius TaxID=185202 RepID=A0ACB8YT78_9ASTR|nr:hypothetical protein L1987_81986 [Smallanthus sonchifolius]